jgi:hypothetical protein
VGMLKSTVYLRQGRYSLTSMKYMKGLVFNVTRLVRSINN